MTDAEIRIILGDVTPTPQSDAPDIDRFLENLRLRHLMGEMPADPVAVAQRNHFQHIASDILEPQISEKAAQKKLFKAGRAPIGPAPGQAAEDALQKAVEAIAHARLLAKGKTDGVAWQPNQSPFKPGRAGVLPDTPTPAQDLVGVRCAACGLPAGTDPGCCRCDVAPDVDTVRRVAVATMALAAAEIDSQQAYNDSAPYFPPASDGDELTLTKTKRAAAGSIFTRTLPSGWRRETDANGAMKIYDASGELIAWRAAE